MPEFQTGTTATATYLIDQPCQRLGWDDQPDSDPCQIAEMDHYGMPAGELLCYTHVQVVGMVVAHG